MSNKQRVALAVGVFVLLGALALLGGAYERKRAAPGPAAGAVTVAVTSPADSGPGTLREALFIAAAAKSPVSVAIRTRTVTLQTALPPLVNAHGVRILAEQPGAEIDARALPAGPVLDITGDHTSIEGLTLRNCAATGILLRAAHFHLLSSVVESCDVGVDVAENAGDILLEHNRFTNDRVGVRFTASNRNTMVVGNTFQQDKDAGLWAVRGTADGRGGTIGVRENHFIAGGSGLVAGNVGLLVERNEFANARDAAIHLIGAGAVIRGNQIRSGATMGIVAENAGEAVIDSNELEQFGTYAIMVRGSGSALVRANRIHNCGYGLAFVLGDPRHPSSAVGNTIIEPKFNGIDIIGDSPILRHNEVLRPHALALHVLDYQQPGGQTVAARPFLEGNNFRADAVQTPEDLELADSQMRAAARRQ
jgi:Right handed beta helix region